MAEVDLGYALGLPPREAVQYFQNKGYKISWNWWDTWQEAHAAAFTVAKATRLEVLESIRQEVEAALRDGLTARDFERRLAPRLQALGWWGKKIIVDPEGGAEAIQEGSPWRLRNIYRTNLQTAYNVGRYQAQRDNVDARPYWQYVAVMDQNTRASHAAMHGKVFPADDPIWSSIHPPNGFGCRCRVRALSERRLRSKNLTVESSEGRLRERQVKVGVDKRTGEEIRHPVTVYRGTGADGRPFEFAPDPGWSYNPGEARQAQLEQLVEDKRRKLPPDSRPDTDA